MESRRRSMQGGAEPEKDNRMTTHNKRASEPVRPFTGAKLAGKSRLPVGMGMHGEDRK
jgi:hypothetical protein